MPQLRPSKVLIVCLMAATVLHAATSAQAPQATSSIPPSPNGISLSPAKVYDNRSLTIMLEQLEKQLQRIKVVDDQKDKLLAALAAFQGARITEVARALSLTGPGTPEVSTTEKPTETGALAVSERSTTTAPGAPTAPTPAGVPSSLMMSPTFGIQAEDLLSDQVTLSYQIMNVRMLLERALSDRLYKPVGENHARLQVVLGFQISIDPPKDSKDKAAFVELSVTAGGAPVSLVSVMPYEKTYNAFAIDRRSNAFSGAAIAKVISLGYSERRGSESLYVYKDADTLAFGNPSLAKETSTATFGWQFRPVLGRPSVTPGLRQMFAVVALPFVDDKTVEPRLAISARTYWRKYDRKKGTIDARDVDERKADLGPVDALTTSAIATKLGPQIEDVQWRKTDDNMAIVTVRGMNLFSGTQVIVGRTVHTGPENGLIFKSDQLLEVRTTTRELTFGDAAVSGRYGDVVPLEVPYADAPAGISINKVKFNPNPSRVLLEIDIVLQSRDNGPLLKLPPEEPLITVGTEALTNVVAQSVPCKPVGPKTEPTTGQALSRPLSTRVMELALARPEVNCWQMTGNVPAAIIQKEPIVSVKYPFRGAAWHATHPIHQSQAITSVARLGVTGSKVRVGVAGRGISKDWRLLLDKEYSPIDPVHENLAIFEVESAVLDTYKKLVVRPGSGDPLILDVPDTKPAAPSPTIDANQKKSVKKETAPAVTFTGAALKGVKAAKFDDKALAIKVSDDGKSITIYLTRAVTAKPGEVVILLETDGGTIQLDLVVVE